MLALVYLYLQNDALVMEIENSLMENLYREGIDKLFAKVLGNWENDLQFDVLEAWNSLRGGLFGRWFLEGREGEGLFITFRLRELYNIYDNKINYYCNV